MRRSSKAIQYTIRCVPSSVDEALRARAQSEGRSLNEVAIDTLQRGLGIAGERVYTDLDHLAGTWVEDPEFDAALEQMDRIDPDLWK